jgi:hypothetical protein
MIQLTLFDIFDSQKRINQLSEIAASLQSTKTGTTLKQAQEAGNPHICSIKYLMH